MSAQFGQSKTVGLNNLAVLKKAMGVTKRYRVLFEETEQFEVYVDANDAEEAENKAREEMNNGNAISLGNNGSHIEDVQEQEDNE